MVLVDGAEGAVRAICTDMGGNDTEEWKEQV